MKPRLSLCALSLFALMLVASNAWASKANVLIVAIGDSTTSGTPFFRSPLETPPDGDGDPEGQYAYWMMRRRPQWTVLNFGIAGETSLQIRARFGAALARRPRYIVILAGVNDIYQGWPIDQVAKNLMAMYQAAQGENIMPVAATVLPFNQATPAQAKTIDDLNAWIMQAADKLRIPLADFNAAVRDPQDPHRLADSPDGLHPDIGGYRKMGLALIDALDPIEKAWR